ncbi:MAG: PhzF family phenazine biosynthesis protein [Oscillospiraceae bacterium]|nr:PhzF family phenazine biosynthesis protein [Oscillospiraceae bacterium]
MKQYIVDAFTDKVFHGNPAAICILDQWIPEVLMMDITRENNLSETAFAVKTGDRYQLRWFTPGGEIDLCGHATLACAFVLLNFYEKNAEQIVFETVSGVLTVVKKDDLYEMDFPAYQLKPVPVTEEMIDAMDAVPKEAYMGRDLLCIFDEAETVRKMQPNQEKLLKLDGLLLHVTAKGTDTDCVSRSFAPKCNVAEDPVCGSGHCHIVPYWANALGKNEIVAYQASRRGGTLYCSMDGNRVKLSGKAALYAVSELYIQQDRG